MIKRLARCIREYKWAAILSPVCMIGEVAMEVTIPLVMKELYDSGVTEAVIMSLPKYSCLENLNALRWKLHPHKLKLRAFGGLHQFDKFGDVLPEVQAEPEEAQTPIASKYSSRLSPSIPSKQKLTLPGSRFSRSPFNAQWGI